MEAKILTFVHLLLQSLKNSFFNENWRFLAKKYKKKKVMKLLTDILDY